VTSIDDKIRIDTLINLSAPSQKPDSSCEDVYLFLKFGQLWVHVSLMGVLAARS